MEKQKLKGPREAGNNRERDPPSLDCQARDALRGDRPEKNKGTAGKVTSNPARERRKKWERSPRRDRKGVGTQAWVTEKYINSPKRESGHVQRKSHGNTRLLFKQQSGGVLATNTFPC